MANTGKGSKSGSSTRSRSTSTGTSKASSSRKKSGSTKRKPTQSELKREREMFREVGLYIFLGCMVFLFLCNFNLIGSFGNMISGLMFGVFGLVAYVFPLYLFWLLAFWYANPGNPYAKRKIISSVALVMMAQMVCQVFANGKNPMRNPKFSEVFTSCKEHRNGGGVIAGSLAFFLEKHLGIAGLILVILLITAIALIFLTEKSLLRSVKDGSDKIMEKRREESERHRELAEIRQQEREERRIQWEEQQAEREEKRLQKEEERKERERQRELQRAQQREQLEREQQERELARKEAEAMETAESSAESNGPEQDIQFATMTKGKIGDHRVDRRDSARELKREEMREAKEDEKTLRMNKKHTGIIFDTDMSRDNGQDRRRDDVHEITWKETDEVSLEETRNDMINPEPVFEAVSTFEEQNVKPREVQRLPEEDMTFGAQQKSSGEAYARHEEMQRLPEEKSASYREVQKIPEDSVYRPDTSRSEQRDNASSSAGMSGQRPKAVLPEKTAEEREHEQQQNLQTVDYQFPSIELLRPGKKTQGDTSKTLKETAERLQQTLQNFGVKVTITDISQGPSVTRYELQPEQGVKVSKIVNLADDIKLNLAATDIRIEAPIPGKAAIGIEVPNKENSAVALRDLIETKEFEEFSSNLAFAVGKNIAGEVVVTDIAKMPHVLIAGATGSGKSVCINTIIMSILYKAKPDDVRMIMIDPKVVELSVYNGIPHLLIPVVTDPKKASGALHWGVAEMTERYKKFADFNVRDLKGYNKEIEAQHQKGENLNLKKLPQIVIIVDELADLMMVCPGEVEESICRLAQLARAAGIHLIIATQRPSVDVITGLIKANMPSRIAFSVSSGVDSRTILDMNGAEKLLGKGDMLFYPYGYNKPSRIQGAFVSDEEVSDVVETLKRQKILVQGSDINIEEQIANASSITGSSNGSGGGDERDEYFAEAGRLIIDKDKASIGMLQRQYKIGFNRAARIMDQLCDYGVVGEEEGTKPRKVLMSMEQFEQLLDEI